LCSDFFIGSVSYTIEDVGITLNSGWHDLLNKHPITPRAVPDHTKSAECAQAILEQTGDHFISASAPRWPTTRATARNCPITASGRKLTRIQRGRHDFYKMEAKTAWYFPGLFKGHVIEAVGRAGIADSLEGGDVPFYDRYYLGGLYSLRGFKYRNIAPRDPIMAAIPNGPTSRLAATATGSARWNTACPFLKRTTAPACALRMFYDAGAVGAGPYSFSGNFDDNWGIGMHWTSRTSARCGLTTASPSRMINTTAASGQFQFGVGYTRDFKMTLPGQKNLVEDNPRRARAGVCWGCLSGAAAQPDDAGQPAALF
jgi:hypothetical protein